MSKKSKVVKKTYHETKDGEKITYLGDTTPEYYRNGGNGRTGKFKKNRNKRKRLR